MANTNQLIQPAGPNLVIDLVADFICPWSFIGVRRLGVALRNFSSQTPPVFRWHGLRMHAGDAAPPQDWASHLATRLPPGVSAGMAEQGLREAGREFGIGFRFDSIRNVADTGEAHRLVHLAAAEGLQGALADRLFRGYFELGEDLTEAGSLVQIGRDAGLGEESLRRFTDSEEGLDSVRADEARLRSLGVTATPNLLLNHHVLVPGSADVPTYVAALDRALFPQLTDQSQQRLH
ncbi:MAG: DsbA family oxidoreductase [Steroidobacteraceae bacterium]